MEVVLNNTDGVTMAKLARTAKLGLTPVHHIRIQKDEDYGVKESLKHKYMHLRAD